MERRENCSEKSWIRFNMNKTVEKGENMAVDI